VKGGWARSHGTNRNTPGPGGGRHTSTRRGTDQGKQNPDNTRPREGGRKKTGTTPKQRGEGAGQGTLRGGGGRPRTGGNRTGERGRKGKGERGRSIHTRPCRRRTKREVGKKTGGNKGRGRGGAEKRDAGKGGEGGEANRGAQTGGVVGAMGSRGGAGRKVRRETVGTQPGACETPRVGCTLVSLCPPFKFSFLLSYLFTLSSKSLGRCSRARGANEPVASQPAMEIAGDLVAPPSLT